MKHVINKEYYDESKYFDQNIRTFADLETPFQKYRISKVLEIYTPDKEERVLDIGCGWGTFCFAIAALCREITGLDFSQKSIDLCGILLKERKFTNIKFVCADAQTTGLKSDAYDVIICADLFEHLYPDISEKVLDECRRLLKKKGRLVIWTPHRGHVLEILKNNNIILKKEPSHVDYKSMEYFSEILKSKGFSILKKYYAESHIPIFNAFERLFSPILPIMRRRIAVLAEKAG